MSVPLVDNQGYDLVVDDGRRLARVQVKTSTCRTATGGWAVELRTNGGNQSRTTSTPFDPLSSDLLYVLTDGGRWLIPTSEITARASLTVGPKWQRFAVGPD